MDKAYKFDKDDPRREYQRRLRKCIVDYLDDHDDEKHLEDDFLSEGWLIIEQCIPLIELSQRHIEGDPVILVDFRVDANEYPNGKPFEEIVYPPTYLKNAWENAFKRMHKRDRRYEPINNHLRNSMISRNGKEGELRNLLEFLFDGRERQIMDLRIDGYNDKQIGERLGLSRSRVQEIRAGMHETFKRKTTDVYKKSLGRAPG